MFISMTGPSDDHSVSSGLCCEWVKNEKLNPEQSRASSVDWTCMALLCGAVQGAEAALINNCAETGNATT